MAQYTDFFNGAATGINATTVSIDSTTTKVLDVSMREQIGIVFTCASHASGNGVFSVDGSNDGTNWVTGLAMVDATATASTTYVTSKTLSSNTTVGMYLPFFAFRYMRLIVAVTTDGIYTATVEAKG